MLLIATCDRKPAAPPAQTAVNTMRIAATEFAFGAPDTVPAGLTTIWMVNQGKEPHQTWVMRIDSGKTMADVQAAAMRGVIPNWLAFLGGPNGALPGDSSNATALLTPGPYVLVCFFSSADGKPHFMKGMSKQFTVMPAGAAMALPAGDVTITVKDYGFDVSPAITAGTHTIRMVNTGPQVHEIGLLKIESGKTMAQVQAWMGSDRKSAPPFRSVGGISGLSVGQETNFTASFGAGEYVLVCRLPDTKDGKPHLAHGMMMPFKVS